METEFESNNYFILDRRCYGFRAVSLPKQHLPLGDPFDGNALKNPNWKWKTSDEAGIEPKDWDMGKTKAGWLHVTGELNRNLWPADTTKPTLSGT